jgi:hypothetical protein
MKQYSFGTFLVDDANRAAFEACRDIADLLDVEPMPVTLVADKGCGKTHLLYSIVNRVRATSADTGLAYITAKNFHPRVRALVQDPAPLQQAATAILMVDQLETFSEHLDELEAVIRVFLHYGHPVVIASSAHPGRLHHLPAGLLELIQQGQTLEIVYQSSESRAEILHRQIREELEERIQQQDAELALLRERHDAAPSALESDLVSLHAQLAEAHQELEHLRAEMALHAAADKEARFLRSRLERAELEVERLRGDLAHHTEAPPNAEERDAEFEALRAQLSIAQHLAEAAKTELEEVRHVADEARAEAEELWAELERTQAAAPDPNAEAAHKQAAVELTALRMEVETLRVLLADAEEAAAAPDPQVNVLRAQLEQARQEEAQATCEAGEMLRRVTALLTDVEASSDALADLPEDLRAGFEQIEALIRQGVHGASTEELDAARATAEDALSRLEALRHQFDDERRAMKQSYSEALASLESRLLDAGDARKGLELERDEARREAAALRAEREALHCETQRLAQQLKLSREKVEETQREAETMAAAAEEESRASEHRVAAVQADLDFTRDSGRNVGIELAGLQRRLSEAATMAADLGRRLDISMQGTAAAPHVPTRPALSEQPLHAEAVFFGDSADDDDPPPFPAGFAVAGDGDDLFADDEDAACIDLGRFDVTPNEQDRLSQPFTPLNPRDLEVPASSRQRKASRHPFRGESEAI